MAHVNSSTLDALVVAPHPDDAELGMAGTIMLMLESNWKVGILDLTDGEPTPHGSVEIRAKETAAASRVLGISWRENLNLLNRFLEPSLEARARLAAVFRQTRPRWLFAPYWTDAHPDHVAATELIEAARFWAKLTKSDLPGEPHFPERILYYYCVHLRQVAQPTFIVDISRYWPKKQAALECFRSQFLTSQRESAATVIDKMRVEAAYWGKMIGAQYGEPFASREPIGLNDLSCLV